MLASNVFGVLIIIQCHTCGHVFDKTKFKIKKKPKDRRLLSCTCRALRVAIPLMERTKNTTLCHPYFDTIERFNLHNKSYVLVLVQYFQTRASEIQTSPDTMYTAYFFERKNWLHCMS